jgi:hypothetical protein
MGDSFERERIIQTLECDEKERVIEEAAAYVSGEMNTGAYNALADSHAILQIRKSHASSDKVFGGILALTGKEDLGDVHSHEDFVTVNETYRGADGKIRHPLPKYVPKHIWPYFDEMRRKYHENVGIDFGDYPRPGLIIQSAYRSPQYQMGVMVRTMAERGVRQALSSVALPGVSQHANYENCAIDINNIGDRYGRTKHGDQSPVDFSETIEFDWLMDEAPKHAFWFSYYPDNQRISGVGSDGIIVEPWHVQFNEGAESLMSEKHVRSLFRMWRLKLNSDRELKIHRYSRIR